MDSLNITIDGHLGLPGFVRVPPPFGTPRDAVRAIQAALARKSGDQVARTQSEAGQPVQQVQWRQRMTLLAIGAACTVAAALTGWHTGQHRQPVTHLDHATWAAIAQPPAPTVAPESLPVEVAPSVATRESMEIASTPATQPAELADDVPALSTAAPIVVAQTPAKAATKSRTLARAVGRAAAPAAVARPAAPVYEEQKPIEIYRATTDSPPIIPGFVAPDTPVRIELQRHTRLTD